MRKLINIIAITFFILALTICREYQISTIVNDDGTLLRTVIVKGDSNSLLKSSFPIPKDDSWLIEKTRLEDEKKTFVYTATKEFKDFEELNLEFNGKSDKINIEVGMDLDFRWFYSYYTYREKYKSSMPFRHIPLDKFLTDKEIENFKKGDIDDELESKLDEWEMRNIVAYYYNQIIKTVSSSVDLGLTESEMKMKSEEFYSAIIEQDASEEDIIAILNEMFRGKDFSRYQTEFDNLFNDIEEKTVLVMEDDGTYINEVTMPGIIISTNAKSIEGNKAIWNFESRQFLPMDFEMNVKSRAVNTWSIVITVGLGILFIFIIIFTFVKKTQNKNIVEG
ncbi:MAG: hypothetical protein K9H06_20180 [Melioribacteraceae bacterium]|nr:hypothetical protein [Melioribacteraceae bacterium]